MRTHRIEDFLGGWVIGNFTPSILHSEEIEVGVKFMPAGSREDMHYQLTATEITIVTSGRCSLGQFELRSGDIAVIEPMEAAEFLAIEDTVLVVVKNPSLPSDKVVGSPI